MAFQRIKLNESKKSKKKILMIGTWNLRLGIQDNFKKNDIIDALIKTNADIIGVQETGAREDIAEVYKE